LSIRSLPLFPRDIQFIFLKIELDSSDLLKRVEIIWATSTSLRVHVSVSRNLYGEERFCPTPAVRGLFNFFRNN
ncbi:MAG: hypothetical protein V4725_16385, partial [Bacteroidota bacterium]